MQSAAIAPTPPELRTFGLLFSGLLCLFFGLLLPWLWGFGLPVWPWPVAALLVVGALLKPVLLAPLYQVWMKIAAVLGWINTRLLMVIIFYGMILPVGLVMRLGGRDALARRFDPQAATYRIERTPPPPDHLRRPF